MSDESSNDDKVKSFRTRKRTRRDRRRSLRVPVDEVPRRSVAEMTPEAGASGDVEGEITRSEESRPASSPPGPASEAPPGLAAVPVVPEAPAAPTVPTLSDYSGLGEYIATAQTAVDEAAPVMGAEPVAEVMGVPLTSAPAPVDIGADSPVGSTDGFASSPPSALVESPAPEATLASEGSASDKQAAESPAVEKPASGGSESGNGARVEPTADSEPPAKRRPSSDPVAQANMVVVRGTVRISDVPPPPETSRVIEPVGRSDAAMTVPSDTSPPTSAPDLAPDAVAMPPNPDVPSFEEPSIEAVAAGRAVDAGEVAEEMLPPDLPDLPGEPTDPRVSLPVSPEFSVAIEAATPESKVEEPPIDEVSSALELASADIELQAAASAPDIEVEEDLDLDEAGAEEIGSDARSGPPPPPEQKAHPPSPPPPPPEGESVAEALPPPPPKDVIDAEPRPDAEGRSEDGAERKRRRPWFETFFNDDYLRTVPIPPERHVVRQCDFIEATLGLQAGATILDVGCGLGLHAVELANRGYLVVGLDLSLPMLSRAADEAQDRGLKINFLHGDMREMTFDGSFDAVLCWGTTLGYFDDDTNKKVIERLYRALKPRGLLVIDVVNRDYVIRSQPNLVWFEGDDCVCMEETQFNVIKSRLEVKRTVILDSGRQRESYYSVRLFSFHELGKILHEQGYRVAQVSGHESTPGAFFGADSPRMIVVAERRPMPKGSGPSAPAPPPPPGSGDDAPFVAGPPTVPVAEDPGLREEKITQELEVEEEEEEDISTLLSEAADLGVVDEADDD
ncbi:MAG: methyltransferase domain-containing protein [Myxococcota bacterium]